MSRLGDPQTSKNEGLVKLKTNSASSASKNRKLGSKNKGQLDAIYTHKLGPKMVDAVGRVPIAAARRSLRASIAFVSSVAWAHAPLPQNETSSDLGSEMVNTPSTTEGDTAPQSASFLAHILPQSVSSTYSSCKPGMALIEGEFCIDKFEASLVQIFSDGHEAPWAPNQKLDGDQDGKSLRVNVRAISEEAKIPQAYISARQAQYACFASGKRLCKMTEWRKACKGPAATTFPYGSKRQSQWCNDHGRSPLAVLKRIHFVDSDGHAPEYGDWNVLNDPELDLVEKTVTASGSHPLCSNAYGVYDMVGNLHEWVDDPRGTFLGGYFQDTSKNGDGCGYTTTAHNASYHDYSTGFRCCADLEE